ncbi:bifunctional tRNA (5-methylaminomethyl-2-thiouridine)(34)-methyltransferase MnmD/FAD-dependent 5-carboxymethylaminomethyl-2-thiouridine(34) oxidoreductase MnmC [Gammaproteobacteria bacterium LSUCC0112]|nr:bifunctional tRNA (5-methylaminomethyl-2-thiouridine)(34)-methyltransferase MnmD/FAD-dependent 5-carboxymethylaminomethyl-2-thiouridine(34) oxidoreductase MnmC [Gammaproteobacteria bacterium LSUCC0112]
MSTPLPPPIPALLEQADLQWQDDGAPFSTQYGDVYFSRNGGLAETEHVFLDGNLLQRRWQALDKTEHPGVFTICELGFGTGLNFLSCWRLWQQTGCQQLRLHYISCEMHPLAKSALTKALQQWPDLSEFSAVLLQQYPDHSPGYHRIPMLCPSDKSSYPHKQSIVLELYFGDALDLLNQQSNPAAKVDAWFLDGFTPTQNPALWSEEILDTIARRSRGGSTLSSYSVTGRVVRHLKSLGFDVQKRKGFGPKRHMLFAQKPQETSTIACTPRLIRTAVVIGAGLAGATVARSLAARGIDVTVIEQSDEIATGASGNLQAIVQLRLNKQADAQWQFHVQSYLYALRFYAHQDVVSGSAPNWHPCGVLTLNSAYTNTRDAADAETLRHTYAHYPATILQALDAAQASELTGFSVDEDGLWQAGGGWMNPKQSCITCLSHPLITVKTHTRVNRLVFDDDKWMVHGQSLLRQSSADQPLMSADVVVIANSFAARTFEQTADMPVSPLRGQVSHLAQNSLSADLKQIICSQRYIAPANVDGTHCVGASYVKQNTDTEITTQEHLENIQKLGNVAVLLGIDQQMPVSGRAGIRGASRDYMPMAGAVPDNRLPEGVYGGALLERRTAKDMDDDIPRLPGLYLSTGHGSHGSVSCPIIAEHIAALICGEHSPLPQALSDVIDPARFIRRQRRQLSRR